jgi:putative transposase
MTATLEAVMERKRPEPTVEQLAAQEVVRRPWEQALSLSGSDGLLKQLTKGVLEIAFKRRWRCQVKVPAEVR